MASTPPPAPSLTPKALFHVDQSRRNRDLSQNLAQDGTFPEWAVTLLFYAALHLVQAHFVQTATSVANIPDNHKVRNERVRTTSQAIRKQYKSLYDLSIQSRYYPEIPRATPAEIAHYRTSLFEPVVVELRRLGVALDP
jgi:hypothetical protein